MKPIQPIPVFITDDHQIIIDGLKALLADIPDIVVCGEANSGQEMLYRMEASRAQVVIMDVDMPGMDGREATQKLCDQFPHIAVIALTMHQEKHIITAMTQAGAKGYLLKNTSQEDLITAIRRVAAGKTYFSSEVTETLLQHIPQPTPTTSTSAQLTRRELEILKLIAAGHSNTQIGEQLHISHRTVDTHRTNLMKKIGVHNIAGLIRYAFQQGLVE